MNTFFQLENKYNAVEHIPSSAGKFPILYFSPGKGEQVGDKLRLLTHGPSKTVQTGWNPNMIVVSVQSGMEWPSVAVTDKIVQLIKARYADKWDGRLFGTGLSAGAWALNQYCGMSKVYATAFSAIYTLSAPPPDPGFDKENLRSIPAWGVSGDRDSVTDKFKALYEGLGKRFSVVSGGHDGSVWAKGYAPEFGAYDWLLQQNPVVTPEPAQKEHVLTPGTDGGVYKDAAALGIKPGDVVILRGNYQYFNLWNLKGASNAPILIVPDGQVEIGGNKSYAFNMRESEHFRIDGQEKIVIDGGSAGIDAVGMAFNRCRNFSLTDIEARNVSVGLMIKTTPKGDDPNSFGDGWAYDNIAIQRMHIHDVGGEGMYIGHSNSGLEKVVVEGIEKEVHAFRMRNLRIFNNVIQRTGWDGLQVTCADGALLQGNQISDYGKANQRFQQFGILAAGRNMRILDNYIGLGTGTGITCSGNDLLEIRNNVVNKAKGADQDAIYINAHKIKDYGPCRPVIEENEIHDCLRSPIRISNTDGYMIAGSIARNVWSNCVGGIVDASNSFQAGNINQDEVIPTPTRKLITTIKIYDNGDIEKI